MARVYGRQCDRCGTLIITGERDTPLCAPCSVDEDATCVEVAGLVSSGVTSD